MSKNPQDYPTSPAPQTAKKSTFLSRLKEKVREPDATEQSNRQLKLNTEREILKTKGYLAKHARPSKLGNLVFGGPQQSTRYVRVPSQRQIQRQDNSLLSMSSGDGLLSPSSGDGILDMVGGGRPPPNKPGPKKHIKSGIEEMFT